MIAAARTEIAAAVRAARDDATRIDLIRELEELKCAAATAQAEVTAAFVRSQRAAQATAGVPAERVGRGIAAQVALARRVSPSQASRYVGWAMILTSELPHTLAALRSGHTSEWRAMIVARETIFLSREDRAAVDRELGPRLEQLGDRRTEAAARTLAYRLDPQGAVDRIAAAAAGRRVSVRPAPDGQCRLTAQLPVQQGVACLAALGRAADTADTATVTGDPRSRGQRMVDTLVERLTGQPTADAVPVEIELVMSSEALLGDGPARQAALLVGYGPLPEPVARTLALDPRERAPRWLRRLFTAPDNGELVALESRRRTFSPAQRRYLRLRDQMCRTPWCEAPIRHADHVVAAEHGGPTATANGAGLCVACNRAKQAPGWSARPAPAERHRIAITTPAGHRYLSEAPPVIGIADELGPRLRALQRAGRLAALGPTSSDGAALQAPALPLGQPAPDAEALVVFERVLEALGAD